MAKNAKMKYAIETAYTVDNKAVAGGYRYGKPEGIVLHENGNDKFPSLANEIAYMTRNYQNAFVHAWNDDTVIKEIANTDFRCWGAGGYANPRFAQIEVLRMRDKAKAIKAIDRGLFWGAYQLYWYDLPCTDATKTGKGTVWTHEAVSRLLGGTNHVDPIGFWASVGITWDMAFRQLKAYYDALHAGDSTKVPTLGESVASAPAPVKSAPSATRVPVSYNVKVVSGGYSIDSKPWGESGFETWGHTDKHVGETWYIYEEDGSGNYLNGYKVGWVDKRAVEREKEVIKSVLHLPNGKDWTIYPAEGSYTAGDVISLEGANGESTYTVLGERNGGNVLIVELPNFGQVGIYFDPDKGAYVEKIYG